MDQTQPSSLNYKNSILSTVPSPTMAPLFITFFCTIYLIGYFTVFRRWPSHHRLEATSCLISLFHGTPAVFLASAALLNSAAAYSAANTSFQSLVLDFSIAYFTVDLLHYILFRPADCLLFIGHHLATLFVFITCRYVALHGAFALLVLLILAEMTSLCQNVWTLAGLRKEESVVAERVYRSLSPPFYVLYTLMRVVTGPVFFTKMSVYYLSGQAADVIPTWVTASWIVVVGGAIAVSVLWIWGNWVEYFRERCLSQLGEKKER